VLRRLLPRPRLPRRCLLPPSGGPADAGLARGGRPMIREGAAIERYLRKIEEYEAKYQRRHRWPQPKWATKEEKARHAWICYDNEWVAYEPITDEWVRIESRFPVRNSATSQEVAAAYAGVRPSSGVGAGGEGHGKAGCRACPGCRGAAGRYDPATGASCTRGFSSSACTSYGGALPAAAGRGGRGCHPERGGCPACAPCGWCWAASASPAASSP
jgi:hypothetical protein